MDAVELVIVPPTKDLGGFPVRRALPSIERRMVGPFVFFDEMGPSILRAGTGLDVRPHPHIGLATVTYLFDGAMLHRDSLGSVQRIEPGAVNWMTAGSGIVHSERTPPEERLHDSRLFGIQSWVALPRAHEESPPAFAHHPAATLPEERADGVHLRLVAGNLGSLRAPVAALSELFYVDLVLEAGARFELSPEHEERAAFPVEGAVVIEGRRYEAGQLLVLRPRVPVVLEAPEGARVMLLGGAALDGPRHIYWNFVSSSKERIEQAKEDWVQRRFAPVPGEAEFIPLPGSGPAIVRYP
ncbi:pirin family protein [Vulgatibacter sp.]|uniref:pirin family protein n=1 Tax=Vulgatibacter sp. TaxID=1971226 RepID=UPI003567EB08